MIWFTADTHFGHKNIIEYSKRPFFNVHDMDDLLIENINKYVQKDDILYHLGDFNLNRDQKKQRQRINCSQIILIKGNHDKQIDKSLFQFVVDVYRLKSEWGEFFLSHYAHVVWNKSHHGIIHLYGHSHDGLEEYLDKLWPERRSMDVGVDSIYRTYGVMRPISALEVNERLGSRKGTVLDHHQ